MTKSLTNSCLTAPIIGKAPKDDVDYAALFEGIEDWDYHYSDGASSSILKSPVKRPTPLSQQFLKAIITSVNSDSTWNSSSKRMEREIEVEIQSKFGPNLVKNVLLCDNWTEVPFKVGNPINLINLPGSSPINTENETLIFSKSEPGHLIVLFPSMLVSATVICDAPECLRRGALNHRLQGKQPFSSEAMVRGIIVHEVIQNMLMPEQNEDDEKLTSHSPSTSSGPWTMSRILKEARKTSARHMENLFLIGKSVEEGIAMVSDYLSELPAWSSRYFTESDKDGETCFNKEAILVDPRNRAESNFELPRIAITKVIDIEEEIWSPKFGLKGQIDATVQAAVVENPMLHRNFKFNQPMNAKHSLFPLEIKTGKKPRGIEHIAQTMLYTLLMSDRYDVEITAGLLFYTSSNELIRVRAVKEELRQLMIVRNRLVIFLSRGPDKISSNPDDVCASPDVEDLSVSVPRTVLPEPIDEESCCKRCFVVDGCMLYRKTVEGVESISSGSDTLDALYKQKMGHISSNQAEFFRHWEGLISLEERELGKLRKSIWELTAEERQKRGHAFTEMVINHNFKFSKKSVHLPDRTKVIQFTYCFVRAPKSSILEQVFSPSSSQSAPVELSLLIGQINEFDPIVISIDGEKLAIARGFVLELKAHHIVVSIDHRLESTTPKSHGTQFPNKWTSSTQSLVRYRIDKDELMAGMGRIRDNLVQLFVRPENLKLRELVVDLKKPEFRSIGEISEKITCFESTSLNENQQDDTKPYCKNCWISDVINPERKVVFIDTDQLESSENVVEKLIKNELEAGLAFQLVEALLRCGVSPSEIAVIAPYKQQIKLLMSMFADSPDLEILTADRSQGRDKDCIIMTMVRSNEQGKVGYLIQDWRRINVCLTRARKKLVIFGSRKTLMNARMMYEFLEFVEQRGWILELERGAEKLHGCLRYHWNTHQPSSNSTDSLILRNTTNLINSPNSKRTLNSSPASSPSRPRKSAKLLPGIVSTLESRSLLRDLTINVLEE
ncbi:DNA replication factor Dna2-domain-containing protein [Phakopsora pachyrhizi]|nr:DNA replication factor Dna2-domain-containing protein [Phakopsora pachyrhizi]